MDEKSDKNLPKCDEKPVPITVALLDGDEKSHKNLPKADENPVSTLIQNLPNGDGNSDKKVPNGDENSVSTLVQNLPNNDENRVSEPMQNLSEQAASDEKDDDKPGSLQHQGNANLPICSDDNLAVNAASDENLHSLPIHMQGNENLPLYCDQNVQQGADNSNVMSYENSDENDIVAPK